MHGCMDILMTVNISVCNTIGFTFKDAKIQIFHGFYEPQKYLSLKCKIVKFYWIATTCSLLKLYLEMFVDSQKPIISSKVSCHMVTHTPQRQFNNIV